MGGGFDRVPASQKPGATADAPKAVAPGKRTLTERVAPQLPMQPAQPGPAAQGDIVDAGYGDVVAAAHSSAAPMQSLFGRPRAVQRKDAKDDDAILANQASLHGTDVEIPALEGALLATRKEAVRRGLLSPASFDAGLALSQTMTQLQPAVSAKVPVDKDLQDRAALAAQQLFASLHTETADESHFRIMPSGPDSGAVSSENPYTGEMRVTTSILFWSRTTEVAGWLRRLPDLIRKARWGDAFRGYRQLLDGLDQWIADQLRSTGKGTPDEALGNAHEHRAQLRTGLEPIADKHATRLPALFHPDAKTVEKDKAAGHAAIDTVPMNVYFWKDQKDGKFHLHDLTTPGRPHEQTIDVAPTPAILNTFFEEVARYPAGEVHYALPGGAGGVAPTTGKTKWYEWLGYAGLAAAGVGLALLTAGASIPATACFAAGALAGGLSASGHLVDTARLHTATSTTVVLDAAQIAASFAGFGAMSLTVRAGSAAAALAGSRWFIPLVGTAAGADVVQIVAFTDVTLDELAKIQNGGGSLEDRQRAMAVLLTQLAVMSGLTALSVQGARNARALAGQPLELVEQNGVKVLRVVGEEPSAPPAAAKPPAAVRTETEPHPAENASHARASGAPALVDAEHWLAELEGGMSAAENAKLAKMKAGKTPQQTREMLGNELEPAHERVRAELRAEQGRAELAAKSKERGADLRRQVIERNLMDDPEIRRLVEGATGVNAGERVPILRDKLVARILKVESEQAHPGAEVLDGVKVYEKLPEANVDEWKVKNPGKPSDGLVERADGLYVQRGEIDMLVIERSPGGNAKIIAREEIKTGGRDSNASARAQLDNQSGLLLAGATGKKVIRLEVGTRDITSQIDLASDAAASKSTRGPAGKGFDKSLGISATDLEAMCRQLLTEAAAAAKAAP